MIRGGVVTMIKKMMDSTLVHILFAFFAMGGWAVFANRMHGLDKALIAGGLQGAFSGTITFFMKTILEACSNYFIVWKKKWLALFSPPLIACSASLAMLVSGHILAKTPELFATIILPFSVAFSYACLYTWRLWHAAEE